MGLWDALSGKIYRWNELKADAVKEVGTGLKRFLASKDTQSAAPLSCDPERFLGFVRDFSYFCFFPIHIYFADADASEFKETLMALKLESYLSLLSICHIRSVIILAQEQDEVTRRTLLDAVPWMYHRPQSYVEDWCESYKQWTNPEPGKRLRLASVASADKVVGELCPILGMKNDIPEIAGWLAMLSYFAKTTSSMFYDPKVRDLAKEELATVPDY